MTLERQERIGIKRAYLHAEPNTLILAFLVVFGNVAIDRALDRFGDQVEKCFYADAPGGSQYSFVLREWLSISMIVNGLIIRCRS